MGRRYTIKQLPPELRPRERLLTAGPSALSDGELLGLLFGIGSREKTAVELAQAVISEAGGLFGLYDVWCTTQFTKGLEIEFRVLLTHGEREVRFERANAS